MRGRRPPLSARVAKAVVDREAANEIGPDGLALLLVVVGIHEKKFDGGPLPTVAITTSRLCTSCRFPRRERATKAAKLA